MPQYTRLQQAYLQERVTYAGINRLTMPELIRQRKRLIYKEDLLEYKLEKANKKVQIAVLKGRQKRGENVDNELKAIDTDHSIDDKQPMKMIQAF